MSSEADAEFNAQVENTINNINSQIHSATPTQLARMDIAIERLLSTVNNPEIVAKLQNLQTSVKEQMQRADTALASKNTSENERISEDESQKDKAFLENEEREKELKKLTAEYASFKDDFVEKLQAKNVLLRKAANGEMTDKERNHELGIYSNKEEEQAAKQSDQEESERWKKHYTIRTKTKESIAYGQSKINDNNKLINNPSTPAEKRIKLIEENKVHEQKVSEHQKSEQELIPAHTEREETRKLIFASADNEPEVALAQAANHYRDHGPAYKEELQRGEQKGLEKELLTLEKLAKLGELMKSGVVVTKEQVADVVKENLEVSSIANQNAKKQADSVKKSLENNPSSKPDKTPNVSKRSQKGKTTKDGHGR